ncbi:MAG: SNF2-related protein [Candidatus Nanopelagicales bacterium]
MLPVLAQAVTQVQNAIAKGDNRPSVRSRFQVIAFVTREERARVLSDEKMPAAAKTAYLKRLDGIAKILAQTGARDTSLLALLGEDSQLSELGQVQRRELLEAAGIEEAPAPVVEREEPSGQVVPQSVLARQLANPFMPPDIEAARRQVEVRAQRLAGWELLGPLLRSFEQSTDVAASCMPLPDPDDAPVAPELHLMKHQAQVVAAAAQGHRTFLLADEPGLGKTAQALLSAQVATAYPLLVVVPNVVKMNWAREVNLWTPARTATVIHSDGESADTFADIVIVNYELLDRHRGWLVDFGFRGMIVDEAHFIKNKTSQRSQNVLEISRRIRTRTGNPLLMALTGTPLINDLDDFLAIWEFLGWIDGTKPILDLMKALEATGLVPGDPGFYAAARRCVIDQGIVRRRKIDVAADIADRRVADLPVELEGPAARSIRQSQEQLTEALVQALRRGHPAPVRGAPGRGHRPYRRAAGRRLGPQAGEGLEDFRQRVHDDAQDRTGQGRPGGRLHRTAGRQRGQGRLLRQAHRRHGQRRADVRLPRDWVLLDPRRSDRQGPAGSHRRVHEGPGRRGGGVLAECRRRRAEPARRLEPGARRVALDAGGADPGDRPRAPHRSGPARDGMAHPGGEHDRQQGGRLDRPQGGVGCPCSGRLG